MAITSDVLDRFQENKVLQTAQMMNNILRSVKDGSFVTMETMTFQIRSSEKYLFGFNHSNYIVTLLFIIPRTVLLSFIQLEAETLDFSNHAFPRSL